MEDFQSQLKKQQKAKQEAGFERFLEGKNVEKIISFFKERKNEIDNDSNWFNDPDKVKILGDMSIQISKAMDELKKEDLEKTADLVFNVSSYLLEKSNEFGEANNKGLVDDPIARGAFELAKKELRFLLEKAQNEGFINVRAEDIE